MGYGRSLQESTAGAITATNAATQPRSLHWRRGPSPLPTAAAVTVGVVAGEGIAHSNENGGSQYDQSDQYGYGRSLQESTAGAITATNAATQPRSLHWRRGPRPLATAAAVTVGVVAGE